jgi:4-amino-4-deoxy-L-arabinose transferase-like glycosyltransferase
MIKNHKSLFIISLIYFFTRLLNLTSLPVFCDEAIYVRWSQIIKSVSSLLFVPLSDGKQPLFMWLVVPFFSVFKDPLFAGRFVSVLAGWGTLITLFFLAQLLFTRKTAIYTAIIYLFLPFSFFFDRLALADNLLTFFGALSLFLSFKLVQKPSLKTSLFLGTVLGLAWLTKSPAIYFIALSLFTFVVLRKTIIVIYPVLSAFIAFVIFNILRLDSQFHMIGSRNLDYVWPIREILKHPFDPLKPHLIDVFTISVKFISWPLIIAVLVVFIFFLFTKKTKSINLKIVILLAWCLLPLFASAAIAKTFTARYILFTLPPLIIIFALFLERLSPVVLFLLLIPNIIYIYQLSFRPFYAQLPPTENGYLKDWTSGWGIKEASVYLRQRAKVVNIIVGTEGSFGTLPNGLQIYTEKVRQLTVIGTGLSYPKISAQLIDARNYGDEVYFLANQSRLALSPPEYELLETIQKYPKPDGDNLIFYRLK